MSLAVRHVAIGLLLCAITTVAGVPVLAMLLKRPAFGETFYNGRFAQTLVRRSFGPAMMCELWTPIPMDLHDVLRTQVCFAADPGSIKSNTPAGGGAFLTIGYRLGWPWAWLEGVEHGAGGSVGVMALGSVNVPYLPRLGGALASIAFWSAASLGVSIVFGRVRRAFRLSTGHCAGCGYDVRWHETDRCPECGEAKPRDFSRPTR